MAGAVVCHIRAQVHHITHEVQIGDIGHLSDERLDDNKISRVAGDVGVVDTKLRAGQHLIIAMVHILTKRNVRDNSWHRMPFRYSVLAYCFGRLIPVT